jgi:hypothetical protein
MVQSPLKRTGRNSLRMREEMGGLPNMVSFPDFHFDIR